MHPRLALAVAFAVVASGAGCASVTWQRDGTAPYEVANDLEACRSSADEAFPFTSRPFEQNPSFGLVPGQNGAPHGSTALVVPLSPGPSGEAASVRQRREERVTACMRGKGYRTAG